MERKFLEVKIVETARGSLREEPRTFNLEVKRLPDPAAVRQFLIDRYGRMPGKRNKIFHDKGDQAETVGFLHSFWNRDISHGGPSWYQTDWVTVEELTAAPVFV
jgi:hypothetical protein